MSQTRLSFPALHVGGSSYEAPTADVVRSERAAGVATTFPAVTETSDTPPIAMSSPLPASDLAQSSPASRPRRKARRVLELLDQISRGHNEWWELLLGRYARTGWVGSLLVHCCVLAALGLLLIAPEATAPPRIITLGTDLEGPAAIGDTANALQLEDAPVVTVESAAAMLANGGSSGDVSDSLAAAFGPPAGRGNGLGGGSGDGAGDDIAGRVQAAGGKGGSLQISIAWSDRNDLDLHLITPSGRRIYYAQPLSPDGGELDVDMNAVNTRLSSQPVENITWGVQKPADGKYQVQIHYYERHVGGPARSPFQVRVQVGSDVRVLSGEAGMKNLIEVAQFEVRDGVGVSLTTRLTELDPDSQPEVVRSASESKRMENRERAANALLAEAQAAENPTIRAGKLRRLIRQFDGTDAANSARQLLQTQPQ